jgi:hypothetical protein
VSRLDARALGVQAVDDRARLVPARRHAPLVSTTKRRVTRPAAQGTVSSVPRAASRLTEGRLAAAFLLLAVEPTGLVLEEGRAATDNWIGSQVQARRDKEEQSR